MKKTRRFQKVLCAAAAAVVGALSIVNVASAQTKTWLGPTGSYTDNGRWTGAARPGATDDVLINLAGTQVNVNVSSPQAVARSIVFDAAGGTFNIEGWSLVVGQTISLLRGTTIVAGSQDQPVQATRLQVDPNATLSFSGTRLLRINEFAGRLTAANGLILDRPLTLDNATLEINGGVTTLRNSMPVGGTGTFIFNNGGAFNSGGGTFTLQSGITVRRVGGTTMSLGPLVNHALIDGSMPTSTGTMSFSPSENAAGGRILAVAANSGGPRTNLDLGPIKNHGFVKASHAAVTLGDGWENTGSFELHNVDLRVNGVLPTVQIASLNISGGGTAFVNTLDNRTATLDLGNLPWQTAIFDRVRGGTLLLSSGSLVVNSGGGFRFLEEVTLDANIVNRNDDVRVTGFLNSNKRLDMGGRNLRIEADARLGGTGTMAFTGNLPPNVTPEVGILMSPNVTTTVENGLTIVGEGGGMLIGAASAPAGTLLNQGTIRVVDGGKLTFNTQALVNQGTIHAGTGAVVTVNYSDLVQIGTVHRVGASVQIGGTIDLAGGVLDLNQSPIGPLDLGQPTIINGTIEAAGRVVQNRLAMSNRTAMVLDDVTLRADVDVSDGASLLLDGDLTFDGSTLRIFEPNAILNARLGSALLGDGTVRFEGTPHSAQGRRLQLNRIGPGITIIAGSANGFIQPGGVNTLLNEGTIIAGGSSIQFGSNSSSLGRARNAGSILVSPGRRLFLEGEVDNEVGGVVQSNGTVSFTNDVRLTNRGSIRIEGGGWLVTPPLFTFAQVANDGHILIDPAGTIVTRSIGGAGGGSITLQGHLKLADSGGAGSLAVGSATINSALFMEPTALTEIELARSGPTLFNDQLLLTQPVDLDGVLRLTGATPTIGQQITIMTYPSFTGQFHTVLAPWSGSINTVLEYQPDRLLIRFQIPEPSGLLALLATGCARLLRRRRKGLV